MALLMILSVLLSILSSLLVLIASTIGSLRKASTGLSKENSLVSRVRHLDVSLRLQVWVRLLDSFLLVAITPVFMVYAYKQSRADSVWDVILFSAAATFGATAILVVRPVVIAALAGSQYVRISLRRHYSKLLLVGAAAIVAGVATAAALTCSQSSADTPSCAASSAVGIIIIATQIFFAILATSALIVTAKMLIKPRKDSSTRKQGFRSSTVASRAPSLSLLIHTQPDPFSRHIDLDLPDEIRTYAHPRTDFGPQNHTELQFASASNDASKFDYGPKMVRGLLGDTIRSDEVTDAAATSLGYRSAVASSTNPYHIGSTFSLASRDALGGFASSKLDLKAGDDPGSKCQSSASKIFFPPTDFHASRASLRSLSPGMLDNTSYRYAAPSRSATEEQLVRQEAEPERTGLTVTQVKPNRAATINLATSFLSIWCSIALSTAAILMRASKLQAFILLASFCAPATIVMLHELLIGMSSSRRRVSEKSEPRGEAPTTLQATSDRDQDRCSNRALSSSSFVVVPHVTDTLRHRPSHIRSFSCPLESELNGYGDSLIGGPVSAKHRQSLSSARSVPYLGKHWNAGKVEGDLVVAPRSSFIRGLNLMLNPHPKLEILPMQGSIENNHDLRGSERKCRESRPAASVSTAGFEGLSELPLHNGNFSTDSERTCITPGLSQDRTAIGSSVTTSLLVGDDSEGANAMSSHLDQSRDGGNECSTDVILNMDDTPGSPRLRQDTRPINEHCDLQSPTKAHRMAADTSRTPRKGEASQTTTSSFSRDDDSQMLGGSSASRLFSEIMDMVRGNGPMRITDQQSGFSLGQNFKRTPPKGYTTIESGSIQHEPSVYDSAHGDERTVIIHSDESSGDFRTAASQDRTQSSLIFQAGCSSQQLDQAPMDVRDQDDSLEAVKVLQEHNGLRRKGSSSSTLSFSSISSRLRSIGRVSTAGGSPFESPSSRGEAAKVKKVRSRTFASAFGIELGILNRNGFKGRRDTPGSLIDSSPSTSAGTCPSSLMDLSFSPSPAASTPHGDILTHSFQGTPSLGDAFIGRSLESKFRSHKRSQSRADSIMDMLDDESGDAIEEMLEPQDLSSCTSEANVPIKEDVEIRSMSGTVGGRSCPEADDARIDAELHDDVEIDLADVTLHDAWERCFWQEDEFKEDEESDTYESEEQSHDMDVYDALGFDPRRMVARAPFLDTVEEEPEEPEEVEELEMLEEPEEGFETEIDQFRLSASEEQSWEISNERQRTRNKEPEAPKPKESKYLADFDPSGAGNGGKKRDGRDSRESLLLEQEAKRRQVAQQLFEHENMFPHKTLSQIEEVTELVTPLRSSRSRTSSATSSSKISAERTSNAGGSHTIHLGLPLSQACYKEDGASSEDIRSDDSDVAANNVQAETHADRNHQDSPCEMDAVEVKRLPFVTPRSRMRCRAAAGRMAVRMESPSISRKADSVDGQLRNDESPVDPSPRSINVRLGQLGMDQGFWKQSPLKLELNGSASSSGDPGGDEDGSFQMVDASFEESRTRAARLRRSLTLTGRKLVRLDHQDSPKREQRNRLARMSTIKPSSSRLGSNAGDAVLGLGKESLKKCDNDQYCRDYLQEKRLVHKPIKKRRKSRNKGVAVMIARHQFTVVDEDDSLIRRFSPAQAGTSRPLQSTT